MGYTDFKSKLAKLVVASLFSTILVSVSSNNVAIAAAPVGGTNPTATMSGQGDSTSLNIAYINAASAIGMSAVASAQTARSVGLAVKDDSLGTSQSATVQISGSLSLYWISGTSTAVYADGGTWSGASASTPANFTITESSTAVAWARTASSGVARTQSVIWTAPSSAGTYTIYSYRATSCTDSSAGTRLKECVPNIAENISAGTQFGKITVTVGGSHPAAGAENAPDTLGRTNLSLFVATATNTAASGAVHPTATLGTGERTAKSKGLLSKDSSFGTAQTATVLAGGALSLYGIVNTASAYTASGGTFSLSQGRNNTDTVTYSSNNGNTVFNGIRTDNGASSVATLWTAPTTPGTYTVRLLTGFVAQSDGDYDAPTTSSLPPTLSGAITVSVVAASAGGSYSAAYSACNTNTFTRAAVASATAPYPNNIDSTDSVANGGAWYIDFDLNDGYNANLDAGNLVVTATNGALVNIGTTAGATPVAGTSSTDVEYADGSSDTVIVTQGTADAPVTTTVTITYNGTTICSKTVTIRGEVAKLTVANVGTQALNGAFNTGSVYWMYGQLGINNNSLFTVVASDSAGNIVSTPADLGTYSADAATLTTTVQTVSVNTRSTSASSTADGRFNFGSWQCGAIAGQANVKIKFTTTATGKVVTSDAFTARCADAPYTFTASLDKASYTQGEIATVTLQFLDSKGNKANSVTAPGASSFTLPMMTSIDWSSTAAAVTKADGTLVYKYTVGSTSTAVTAGTYTGTISYTSLAAAATATPTYKISTGSSDVSFTEVLKSVVALIASINKQIQALQKLILRR